MILFQTTCDQLCSASSHIYDSVAPSGGTEWHCAKPVAFCHLFVFQISTILSNFKHGSPLYLQASQVIPKHCLSIAPEMYMQFSLNFFNHVFLLLFRIYNSTLFLLMLTLHCLLETAFHEIFIQMCFQSS